MGGRRLANSRQCISSFAHANKVCHGRGVSLSFLSPRSVSLLLSNTQTEADNILKQRDRVTVE